MFELNLEAECNDCGSSLAVSIIGTTLYIVPCEKCMDARYDEGYRACKDNYNIYQED